jgi:excisionase family DNA binding protein
MRVEKKQADAPLLIRKVHAAQLLGVSTETFRQLVLEGTITPVHIGRSAMFRRADVERLAKDGSP